MTGGEPDPGFRYWAFISYSHTDKAWGAWLHKALETYPIPQRLIGMPIAAGTVPARLKPVFRDRDELPTATDLGFTIEEALRQSWSLVVICSPASAQSRWVNEEVLAFQKLGRGERIHCLIVEGAPDAHATPCFPPALAAQMPMHGDAPGEPIGADARPEGDGRTHARIKLIAGILGVPFDKLARREQQRRHRTMFLITCASLLLATLLVVFSVVTITSRRDAESQRTHAEGLVEFMLGDLRKKLEPDGKLATLDAVGKEALAYYAAQEPESLDADALARRARALQQIGEVLNLRGQLDEALGVFKQAADTTAELLEREPDVAQRIFDHAQSVFWVGYIAYQRGDFMVAEPAFNQYKALAEQLVAIDPSNPDWQAEVGYANSNLGTLLYSQGRVQQAAAVFAHELEMAGALSRAKPFDLPRQMRTGQAHAWLADSLFAQGQLADAAAHRLVEVSIYEALLGNDRNQNVVKEALSVAERSHARIVGALGNAELAASQMQRSADIAEELLQVDPENSRWAEISAEASIALAEMLDLVNQHERAEVAAGAAKRLARRLVERDNSVISWQMLSARIALHESEQLWARGDDLGALRLAEGVQQRVASMSTATQLGRERLCLQARAWISIARRNLALGREDEARAAWQSLVELLAPVDSSGEPFQRAYLITGLRALGRESEAARLIEQLAQTGFRERGYITSLAGARRATDESGPGQGPTARSR